MLFPVFNTFFPRVCATCQSVLLKNERVLCTDCLHRLPCISDPKLAEEHVKMHFYGRMEIDRAASLLFYQKKGLSQNLIHQLKYKGDERISKFLGEWLAENLKDHQWPYQVDLVIPVPLHKRRRRKRGFNQVSGFGRALADAFGCDYREALLVKTFNSATQVFKNRFSRSELKSAFFALPHPEKIAGKHILLADDLITTGSTLESCARRLLKGSPSKISLATMAVTV